MAKLQMLTRLGTPVQPLQSILSPCILRLSTSSCAASSTTRERLSVSVSACASAASSGGGGGGASGNELCSTGGWATYFGSRRSTERGISRGTSVLESEAAVGIESRRASDSTQSTQPSSLQVAFEAQAKAGRVECSSRGCRPIVDEIKESCAVVYEDWGNDEASSQLEARAASYTKRRTVRDLEMCPDISFPLDFAEFVNDVWQDKTTAAKYFEIAMKRNPNDANILLQYANFVWKTIGDMGEADKLFARALEESHNDAAVHATYALFLWQTEECTEILSRVHNL